VIGGLPKRIHFCGAAGAGMLPLALLLRDEGHAISAEDAALDAEARRLLEGAGADLSPLPEGGPEALVAVHSSALAPDHPRLAEARRRGLEILRRGDCLARVARERRLLAVAGSHGKSTAAAMLADLFEAVGLACSRAIGARYADGRPPGRGGTGPDSWLVAEIDESDGTIESFDPQGLLLLNAGHDHHRQYPTSEAYCEAFARLAGRTGGPVVLGPNVSDALARALEAGQETPRLRRLTAGEGEAGRVRWADAGDGCGKIELALDGGDPMRRFCNRSEPFNLANAAAVLALFREILPEASPPDFLAFSRLRRRQAVHWLSPEARVWDDYAHHPEEIAALLAALPEASAARVIVFQPHRYSRTAALKAALAEALSPCRRLYLIDTYAAGEAPSEDGGGGALLAACRAAGVRAEAAGEGSGLLEALEGELLEGRRTDFLFLGAGIVDRLARQWAERLERRDRRWGRASARFGRAAGLRSKFVADEPLAPKTTLRVGGAAERYAEPATLEELQALARACRESGLPFHVLGRGSNVIVPDEGVAGCVVRLSHPYWRQVRLLPDGRVLAGAGLRTKELCGFAARRGLVGFEFLEGIPGSVGGALRMNAGAMGGWMFDLVERVRYLDASGEIVEAGRGSLRVGYRRCEELEDAVALEAILRPGAAPAPTETIRRAIDVYQSKRRETQPREPSAGCVFKNPEGDAAGRLIEELGLKGTAIGGAEISPTHANFIVNRGGATAADVIELVNLVRRQVRAEKRIDLQPEALLYGRPWKEVLS